ncbi:hypothetical protein GDO81_015174 [Engystomops pustulosus]|uniref:Uncharacterized protein n=1 Tax=Engystomops pustulosus TaxID=76066 RepID=A0AAV7ALC8_ENGPU|nr:hypothetical protein GDO81_015174 [Engystomops pustulosus]
MAYLCISLTIRLNNPFGYMFSLLLLFSIGSAAVPGIGLLIENIAGSGSKLVRRPRVTMLYGSLTGCPGVLNHPFRLPAHECDHSQP